MRRVLAVFSLLAVSTAFAKAPQKPGSPEFFRELTEQRAAANVAGDRAFYEKLLSKDFVIVGDNGVVTPKTEYLDIEFGSKRPKEMQPFYSFSDFRVVAARPNLAVISYIKTEGMKVGEQTFAADARRLDTYALEDGQWRLLAMAALRITKPPKRIVVSVEKLAAYAGRYVISPGIESVVTVAGDHLAEQTTGQPATQLIPVGPDTFFDPGDSPTARTTFRRDDSGKVISEVYSNGDQEVVGKRSN
jgi:uncharacterized protein DUF4440